MIPKSTHVMYCHYWTNIPYESNRRVERVTRRIARACKLMRSINDYLESLHDSACSVLSARSPRPIFEICVMCIFALRSPGAPKPVTGAVPAHKSSIRVPARQANSLHAPKSSHKLARLFGGDPCHKLRLKT